MCSIRGYRPYLVLLTWPVHLSCLSTCCAGLLLGLTVAVFEGILVQFVTDSALTCRFRLQCCQLGRVWLWGELGGTCLAQHIDR